MLLQQGSLLQGSMYVSLSNVMCAAVSVRTQRFPFSQIRVPHFPLLSRQRERERAAGSGSYVNCMSDHHVCRTVRYALCGCLCSYIFLTACLSLLMFMWSVGLSSIAVHYSFSATVCVLW